MSEQSEDFNSWLDELPDKFIECRSNSHRWRTLRIKWDQEHHCYTMHSRCTQCRCDRDRRISAIGEVLSNQYNYPDHYLAPPGAMTSTKDARATLRLTSVTRWIEKNGG